MSDTVLVFASRGYFDRKNCIRELRHSVESGKRIIAMLEPDANRGGLTVAQVEEMLCDSPHVSSPDEGAALAMALFQEPPIEWNRLGVFQNGKGKGIDPVHRQSSSIDWWQAVTTPCRHAHRSAAHATPRLTCCVPQPHTHA